MSIQTASRLDRWPSTTALREPRASVQVLPAGQAECGTPPPAEEDAAEQARRALQASLDLRQ